MSKSNPSVAIKKKAEVVCPVCGVVTYSRGGIHPQCSQVRADAPRVNRLKAAKKVAKLKVKTPPTVGPTDKQRKPGGAWR